MQQTSSASLPKLVQDISDSEVDDGVLLCLQVVAAGVFDGNGDANTESEVLMLERGFLTAGGGITLAGNFVPFGRTACLTPSDLVSFQADCPIPVNWLT